MPTRTLCRPVVLLLSFGWSRSWHQQHPDSNVQTPAQDKLDFGKPQVFITQKVEAIQRAKKLLVAAGAVGLFMIAALVLWLAR